MGYPLRPKNLKKSGFNDDNIAALRDLQRRVSALTEGQPNTGGVGALTWDEDRGTYNIAGTGDTSFKIGEDLVYYAKNTSGSTIPIGSSVMFTGAVGASGLLTFGLAVADGSVDPDFMMGITQQEIENNGFGYVKHFGLLRGFRTDGVPQGETWSDGDLLYFDATTPGSLTKVKPISPAIHEPIAVVVTASQGNNGSIFVRMKVSESLATLRDVYVNGSLTNGDVLIYDVTQDRFEANTLTAGANISITNGPGSITISSTTGTETDPIFTASPAFGITSGDIANWNTAYGWGNHALAGYLTSYTETDPTVPAHVKSITTTNISNWNTAYGWGDHSTAGYLTSFTETDPTVPPHVKSITTTNITNWNTAYGWGNHATAGYQSAATALTTSTTFGGDVSGTYNAIVVADDSHNHIISNVDGLQTALNGKVDLSGDTMSGDLIISKADARLKLYDSTGTNGNNPYVEWETTANQGIAMELNVYDSDLPVSGYGLVVREGPSNGQFPTTGTLTFNVLGEMYAGGTSLGSLNKVFHDGYHPNADRLTTARTISLTGDVSGSTSFNGSANVSITATVADDSHNHIYDNIDGLTTNGWGGPRITTASGYIDFGPANTGYAHIYTDRPSFYFNVDASANITYGRASVRAPIFYDSANTAYYLDPASTGTSLTTAGSVGIGTTSPDSKVDIEAAHSQLRLTDSDDSKFVLFSYSGGKLITRNNSTTTSTEQFTLDESGRVGIGTISPSQTLQVQGTGYATSDFRAPIFYDSDNTGFNLNANGSAWQLQTPTGYLRAGPMNLSYCHFATDRPRYYFDKEVQFDGGINDYSGNWQLTDSLGQHNSSLRAPIFYDSNNTGYYTDPASTSQLNALTLASNLTVNNGNIYGPTYINMRYGSSGAGGIRLYDADGTLHGYWYGNGGGEHGFLDNDGSWAVRIRTGTNTNLYYCNGQQEFGVATNHTVSYGSSRAPIFYDSNNTNFYVNPDGTTSANFNGDINFGGELNMVSTTAENKYIDHHGDLRFRYSNNSSFFNERLRIAGSGNFTQAVGSLRAPIFYDSDNTGRYADLSSTGDSIRASGDIVAYYSDDRLKDRGDNIANALDKVQSLNGFHYTANETAQKLGYKAHPQVGVSAQEVEAILPEVVKDAAIGHGYKTVDYAKLMPLLIEAIKELKAEVETLKKG